MALFLVLFKQIYPEDGEISEHFFHHHPDFILYKENQQLVICRRNYLSLNLQELYKAPEELFKRKKKWIKLKDHKSMLNWCIDSEKHVIKKYQIGVLWQALGQLIPYLPSKLLRAFY